MRYTRKLILIAIILSTLGAMAWADVPDIRLFMNKKSYRGELLSAKAPKLVVTVTTTQPKIQLADIRQKPPLPKRLLESQTPIFPTTLPGTEVKEDLHRAPEAWNRVTVEQAVISSFASTLTIRACDNAAKQKFGDDLPVITECKVLETDKIYQSTQKTRDNDYQSRKLQWMER